MTELLLFNNELDGSIPVELGKLAKLGALSLNNNRLSGEIPVELGKLKELMCLDLKNNRLTGGVPVEFGGMTNLKELFISNNFLSGKVSVKELSGLEDLKQVDLRENNFHSDGVEWLTEMLLDRNEERSQRKHASTRHKEQYQHTGSLAA
ncbi:hypothetical protein HDU98_011358 [Podochytrium sp. JEL0797]|nr:hypothetical protein HDU98_011358 [Podochytrium sp. JEL0797]